MSQPAVTQAIAKLERGVGAALFDRTRTGFVLTERGEILRGRVRRAMDRLDGALITTGLGFHGDLAAMPLEESHSVLQRLLAVNAVGPSPPRASPPPDRATPPVAAPLTRIFRRHRHRTKMRLTTLTRRSTSLTSSSMKPMAG